MNRPLPIVIALGGGQGGGPGGARVRLDRACRLLNDCGARVVARSRLYWTRPWGGVARRPFLNAAVCVTTQHTPRALLSNCLSIERRLGRRRATEPRWGDRLIDLDLILYGGCVMHDDRLTLPHPELARRDFVLAPLADLGVAPDARATPVAWRIALARLASNERTIVHVEPWV